MSNVESTSFKKIILSIGVNEYGSALAADHQGPSSSAISRFTLEAEVPVQPIDPLHRDIRAEGITSALLDLASRMLAQMGIQSVTEIEWGRVVMIKPPGASFDVKGVVGVLRNITSEHIVVLAFEGLNGALVPYNVPISYGAMCPVGDLKGPDGLVRAIHLLKLKLQPECLPHASLETLELLAASRDFSKRFHALQRLGRYDDLVLLICDMYRGYSYVDTVRVENLTVIGHHADAVLRQRLREAPDVHECVLREISQPQDDM